MIKKAIYLLALLLGCINITGYATVYYNKAAGIGALQTLSNWGTSTTGTGTAPSNFTTAGDVFNIVNGTSPATITAPWVITGVTVVVGNGSTLMGLTIPAGSSLTGTGVVNLSNNTVLTLQNTTNPTLGTLNGNSTVDYNGTGAQTVVAATYGNLTVSGARAGTPAITFSGTTTVTGTATVTLTGAVSYVTTGNTFVYGKTTGGLTKQQTIV